MGTHSKPKIDDLHVLGVVDHKILEFYVAMDDIPRVQILDAFEDLSEDLPGIVLRESSIWLGF